jgi:hypothetical protein
MAGTFSDPGQMYSFSVDAGGYWEVYMVSECTEFTIGPFPTNGQTHSVLVEAQAQRSGFAQFSDQGAFGVEDEWVPIISVTNGTSQYEHSGLLGTLDVPLRPEPGDWANTNNFPDGTSSKGNVHQTRITVSYGARPYYWTVNGTRVDNPESDPRCSQFSKSVSLMGSNITSLKSAAETDFASAPIVPGYGTPYAYASITRDGTGPTGFNWSVSMSRSYGIWDTVYISTQVPHGTVIAFLRGQVSDTNSWSYDNNGDAGATANTYKQMPAGTEVSPGTAYKFTFGDESLPVPSWPETPTTSTTKTKGYVMRSRTCYIPWQFNYCTNKYW